MMHIEYLARTTPEAEVWYIDMDAGPFTSRGAALRYVLDNPARYPNCLLMIGGHKYLSIDGRLQEIGAVTE